MTDRLPTREELELEASIYHTHNQIVNLTAGVDVTRLPEDVQQGIRDARRATGRD